MIRPLRLAIGLTVATVVIAGGIAVADSPDAAGVITACYDDRGQGDLRIVDGDQPCKSNETRLTWNQEGPPGEPGPQGEQGPQGPAGDGVSSFDGLDGLTCRVGDPLEGVIEVTYGPDGAVSLACLATALEELTVTLGGSAPGSVYSTPAGIACGGDCTESYRRGTAVQLTAVPAGGTSFLGWTGACTGSAPTCRVTMDAARSVTASFAPNAVVEVEVRNPLVVTATYGTSVVTGPGGFACTQAGVGSNLCRLTVPATGAPVTLQAQPDGGDGDGFTGWSGPCSGALPVCTFLPPGAGVVRVTATFRG